MDSAEYTQLEQRLIAAERRVEELQSENLAISSDLARAQQDRDRAWKHMDDAINDGLWTARTIAKQRDDLHSQIKKLADFIIEEIPGEPSTSDGAVDVAIRLLRNYIQAITDNDLLYDLVDEAISTWLGDYASTVEVMAKLTALRDRHRP